MQIRLSRRAFTDAAVTFGVGLFTQRMWAEEKPNRPLKMGMLQGMFREAQPALLKALAKPFHELVQKQIGFTGEVEICAGPLEMVEKLREKALHLGVFHSFEFAWAQQLLPELRPLVVTRPVGDKVQAVVMVNRTSQHARLADLTETVIIPHGAKAHALAYFEKVRATLPKESAKPVNKNGMTPEELLGAVANGDQTAALIDVGALEGYQTLQPGAFKLLKILHQSEEFPTAVVAYRKDMISESEAQKLQDGLSTANQTTTGKTMLMLWNLKGFEVPSADYQKHLDAILKAYPLPVSK